MTVQLLSLYGNDKMINIELVILEETVNVNQTLLNSNLCLRFKLKGLPEAFC